MLALSKLATACSCARTAATCASTAAPKVVPAVLGSHVGQEEMAAPSLLPSGPLLTERDMEAHAMIEREVREMYGQGGGAQPAWSDESGDEGLWRALMGDGGHAGIPT
mmetsp:Transcript_29200/g.92039  ORF Transcript_29200/g.92039 Transcript_29200/m.92039 type:complete len:108 (-) Transcript_29200:7-330(-)